MIVSKFIRIRNPIRCYMISISIICNQKWSKLANFDWIMVMATKSCNLSWPKLLSKINRFYPRYLMCVLKWIQIDVASYTVTQMTESKYIYFYLYVQMVRGKQCGIGSIASRTNKHTREPKYTHHCSKPNRIEWIALLSQSIWYIFYHNAIAAMSWSLLICTHTHTLCMYFSYIDKARFCICVVCRLLLLAQSMYIQIYIHISRTNATATGI